MFIIFAILCFLKLCAGDFAYVSYNTYNIGDDFQMIAAKRLLPESAIGIDREHLAVYDGKAVNAIINGWYVYSKDYNWYLKDEAPPESTWPPSQLINPLVLSFHLTKNMYPIVLNEEGIAWLKKHEPIGARDIDMMFELKKRGIDSYFSACLTLTLEPGIGIRENVIYAVDVDDEEYEYLLSITKTPIVRICHDISEEIRKDPLRRAKMAERLLENYRHAKAVVTTRLHAFLPCLAFETPVLLIDLPNDQYRYDGLKEFGRYCTRAKFLCGCVDFDFDNPTPNPRLFVHFRDQLIKKVKDWVEAHE